MGRVEEDVIGVPVTSLSRTRDGKGVLVSTLDSTLRLMDRENGTLLKSYSDASFTNTEFRLGSVMGGNERWVLSGNETPSFAASAAQVDGEVTVWETVSGKIMERIRVPGVNASTTGRKRIVGSDGKEKQHRNVISCLAWKENGRGDQWCCAGTDGIVSVFGTP
jgi:mitogen-activated protein kinase organizer 1